MTKQTPRPAKARRQTGTKTKPKSKRAATKPAGKTPKKKRTTKPRGGGAGRPPHYDDPVALGKKIVEYFAYCDSNLKIKQVENADGKGMHDESEPDPLPYTISGLCLHLGFAAVQTLHDYQDREEFSDLIKGARLRIEAQDERRLKQGKGGAGLIFVTKNRHGWSDKIEMRTKNWIDDTLDEMKNAGRRPSTEQ